MDIVNILYIMEIKKNNNPAHCYIFEVVDVVALECLPRSLQIDDVVWIFIQYLLIVSKAMLECNYTPSPCVPIFQWLQSMEFPLEYILNCIGFDFKWFSLNSIWFHGIYVGR